MKMKCWPLVMLLATMAWACSDDDVMKEPETEDPDTETPETPETPQTPETPGGKKLVFTITGNVFGTSAGYSGWLLISDKEGNVLDTVELKNDESHTFEAAKKYTEETVTLTLIRNYPGYTLASTYAQVPFGDYGLKAVSGGTRAVVGPAHVLLEDYTDGQFSFSMSGPSYPGGPPQEYEITAAGADFLLTTRAAKSKVLFVRTDEPFQYTTSEIVQNTDNIVHAADFKAAESRDFEIPDAEYATWIITGFNSDGQFPYYSWGAERFDESVKFRAIPVLPDFFTSYNVVLTARNYNASEKYTYKGTEIPTSMKHLDGTLTYSPGGDRQVWETTGVADAVKLSVLGREGAERAEWEVYGATGDQVVVVPIIPETVPLSGGNMTRSFGELANEYEVSTDLMDYLEYTGYMDVIVKPALVPGTSFSWKEVVNKQILASIYLQ